MHLPSKLVIPGTACLVFSALSGAVLSGCRTLGESPRQEPIEDSGSLHPSGPGAGGTADYAVGPEADVETLVDLALLHHPGIRAAEARVRRMLAKIPQAGAWPDPKVKFSAGSMAETAAGRMDLMTAVEQALPFPGKLREMAQAAGKDAEAAAARLEGERLRVSEQVRQAYWNYYLAARTNAISRENREALSLVRDTVDARVTVNQAGQDDQLRLATELGKIDKTLIEARQAEAGARARLNSLLNRPSGAPLPDPVFRLSAGLQSLDGLLAEMEAGHPDIRAAGAELEAYRHRLQRARLERYPDFSLGLQHGLIGDQGLAPMANGRDQVIATIGVTLPLWQAPRRARVAEAVAGIEESAANADAARARLRHLVEDAWLQAGSAEALISLFDEQILPESQQAFDVVLAAYAAGTRSFVDVLDAWRQLLALQLQQARNRAQLGMALASLQSATGKIR